MERSRDIYSEVRQSNKSYKIDCEGIQANDTLYITITHSGLPEFKKKYTVPGSQLIGKKSISFNVVQTGNDHRISWVGSILPRIDLSK